MQYKILLVEDNGLIRENTAELLELNDFNVFSACDGQEGLIIAIKEIPDLILSDIRMPGLNGYQLLELIRMQPSLHNSRFVFYTAFCEKKDIELGLQLGANDYIVKPVDEKELMERLKKLLE